MGSERVDNRKEPRVSLRVPIHIASADGIVRKTIPLESRDISAGGLSFETGREPPLEAESQVVVSRLGDVSAPILIRGRVVWTKALPETGRYLVGIQFTDFDGLTREELVGRMETWAKT